MFENGDATHSSKYPPLHVISVSGSLAHVDLSYVVYCHHSNGQYDHHMSMFLNFMTTTVHAIKLCLM